MNAYPINSKLFSSYFFLLNAVISPSIKVLLGCPMVSTLNPGRRVLLSLSYLDLSECVSLDDTGLQMIGTSCPNLTHLYLRKCINISGKSTFIFVYYSRKMYKLKFIEMTSQRLKTYDIYSNI